MNQIKTGEFLRALRKEQNLTQEQLAEKFGVSNRSVSRWENGINMPDISLLVKLADFYNVDIGEIITGERKDKYKDTETKEEIEAVVKYAENEKSTIKKKSKKRTVTISILLSAVFLFICLISNFIVGNPLSYLLVKHNAAKFITDSPYFRNSGYEINSVFYDYLVGNYIVSAMKNNSSDSKISIYYGFFGDYRWDDSADVINECKNVKQRMDKEYTQIVREAYEKNPISEHAEYIYADIATEGKINAEKSAKHIRILPSSELQLNMVFDYSEIGAESGMIDIAFGIPDLSTVNPAQILLQLKEIFDKSGVSFVSISIALIERDENKNDGTGCNGIYIKDFPYSEIYEESLEERITDFINL